MLTHHSNLDASCCSSSGGGGAAAAAKVLDVSNMEIILRGKQWDRAEDPCAKNAIHLLERNEALVTWLQPKASFFSKNFF